MPGSPDGSMNADAFRRAMVAGDEHGDLAVPGGERCGHIGAPNNIDRLGDDRAVVAAWPSRRTLATCRGQHLLTDQPADPLL